MLEFEAEKSGNDPKIARMINALINHLSHCTWCDSREKAQRFPTAPGCDAFAVWGSRTEGGRLFSSRNLDWKKNTGISNHKLVMVLQIADAVPYATFGFTHGISALAGMNAAGLTVSEMNLDNSRTAFDGPPFPLRLRMILERSTDLGEAKRLWRATNNTDSMNYLIASGDRS